jgi:hypothetical protein
MWVTLFGVLGAMAAETAFPPGAFIVVPPDTWLRTAPTEDAPGFRQPERGPGVLRVIRAEGSDWLYVETRGVGWGDHCQRTTWALNGPLTVRLYVRSTAPLDVLDGRVTVPELELTADAGTVIDAEGRITDGWTLPAQPPPGRTRRWYMAPEGGRTSPGSSAVLLSADADALGLKLGGAALTGVAHNVWYRRPVTGEAHGWLRTRCVTFPVAPLPEGTPGLGGSGNALLGHVHATEPVVEPGTPLLWPDGRPAGSVRAPWSGVDAEVAEGLACTELLRWSPRFPLERVELTCPAEPVVDATLAAPAAPCAPLRVCFPADALGGQTASRQVVIGEPTQASHVRVDAWMGALALHSRGVQDCAADAWARRPETAGEVAITLSAGADGAITRAFVLQDGTNDPELAVCLRDAVQALRLPTDGGAGSVTQRFVLPGL